MAPCLALTVITLARAERRADDTVRRLATWMGPLAAE
jgi:hypothetical protein